MYGLLNTLGQLFGTFLFAVFGALFLFGLFMAGRLECVDALTLIVSLTGLILIGGSLQIQKSTKSVSQIILLFVVAYIFLFVGSAIVPSLFNLSASKCELILVR